MQFANMTLQEAADASVMGDLLEAGGEGGIIAVDRAGNVALVFNTPGMYRASINAEGQKSVAIYGDESP